MIPNSSFCFLCCVVLLVVWFGMHFRIRVYCLECAMRMLRLGYLFRCVLCVLDVVFLLTFQSGLHMNYCRFCTLIYIYRGVGCIWCFLVLKAILKLVFLNKLVTLCMSGL